MSKMKFLLPGMSENFQLNIRLLELMKKFSYCFYENIDIHAFYGNFQFCIWDGGRTFPFYKHSTKEEIEKIVYTYNNIYNTAIRFVFTNNQIKENHLLDKFCNMVLTICHNEKNEIVVNSKLLEDYIRKNYPKYKIISSTTKCLISPNSLKEELTLPYEYVCLDYNLNKNIKLLNSMTLEEKNKAEFLVNAICPAGCKNRKEHYRLNSLSHLNYGQKYELQLCEIKHSNLYPFNQETKNNLTYLDCKKYYDLGFNNFKLEGRTFNPLLLGENYVSYLVKPEYQLFILDLLVNYGK